jgi:hypothetical protein
VTQLPTAGIALIGPGAVAVVVAPGGGSGRLTRRAARLSGGDDLQQERAELERSGVRRVEGEVDVAVTVVLGPNPGHRAGHRHAHGFRTER